MASLLSSSHLIARHATLCGCQCLICMLPCHYVSLCLRSLSSSWWVACLVASPCPSIIPVSCVYFILQSSGMDFKSKMVSQHSPSCSPAFGGLCLCSIKTSTAQWLEKLAFVSELHAATFCRGEGKCTGLPQPEMRSGCCGCLSPLAVPVLAGVTQVLVTSDAALKLYQKSY